jgi:predicted kinase
LITALDRGVRRIDRRQKRILNFCGWVGGAGTVAEPVVIVFVGLPGTGKSTLAEAVARRIDAPAFAGDWLLGALAPHGVLSGLDRQTYGRVYADLLGTLVSRQVMLGQSAVVDCLLDDRVLNHWRDTAADHGAGLRVVHCVCTDPGLHRQRVTGRRRGIPGWHEIDWDHVQRMRQEFPPPSSPTLTVDAVDPLARNLQLVLDHVGAGH